MEKRKKNKQFTIYYYEKVTLGNNAEVPENELIQYVVDGFEDKILQNQVKMF